MKGVREGKPPGLRPFEEDKVLHSFLQRVDDSCCE